MQSNLHPNIYVQCQFVSSHINQHYVSTQISVGQSEMTSLTVSCCDRLP